MIIQTETIFVQLSNYLSHESRGHSVTNSDNSKYWVFKTAIEIKKNIQQCPFELVSYSCNVIMAMNLTSLTSSISI